MPPQVFDKITQESKVLNALLMNPGEWVNGRYFLHTLYLSQYHRAIWNLENKPHWQERLRVLGYKIGHSEDVDEFGFKSYRLVPLTPPGQLFNLPPVEPKAKPFRVD